jgi:MYXO-CTERM domain-containing protein
MQIQEPRRCAVPGRSSIPSPGLVAGLVMALMLALAADPARADWPLSRANPQRTAAATGVSDLRQPVPYWRHYLGGAIGPRGVMFLDVDHDSLGEVLLVMGGKLVAKERGYVQGDVRGDVLLWETPVLGISEIVAARDLDGDGKLEIVVRSSKQVYFIEPATGRVLWQQPADDFGYLGGVRIGDLDGDGIDDLVVQECGCCRINNGNTGFMYSFAAGFDAAPAVQKKWTMASVRCGGHKSMVIVDIDGDGKNEVTEGWSDGIAVLDGATGTPVAPRLILGPRSSESQCIPADIDGDGAQELVCLQNSGPQEDPRLSHRLYVIEYVAASGSTPARLQVRWDQTVGEVPRRVAISASAVSDLDGDGKLEIVVSGMHEQTQRWVGYVYDASSGSLLAEIPGALVAGVLQQAHGKMIVYTDRTTVMAVQFDRQKQPVPFLGGWELGAGRVIHQPDWERAAISHVASELLTFDANSDGVVDELFVVNTRESGGLIAYDLTSYSPWAVAIGTTGKSTSVLAAWVTPALPGEPARVLMASSDGILKILDIGLQPIARGVRFGGYHPRGDWRYLYMTPAVADLGNGADSVVITDSRGALVRIDARDASLAAPPEVPWSVPGMSAPMVVPGLDSGAPGIVCQETTLDGDHGVVVLDAGGARLRSAAVGGQLLSDMVPAQLDGDGIADFIIQWGERDDLELRHRAYSGATLDTLWDATPQYKGTTRLPAGGAVVDWNGDGVDDFVHQYYGTQVLSGADGSILGESENNGVYFMPIVLDVDGDPEPELILQAGFGPTTILDASLQALWTSTDDDRPYPYGAVAAVCPDRVPRLIEGSLRHPARLKLTELGGVAMGSYRTIVLAGGQTFDSEDSAASAGVFMGQLTSTSVHDNLMGDGRPIAVVGSEDGWLYAIDGCTGDLAFAVPFGAAVGAIAFGDTDGNGKDEIIVAVGDGYLYALKEPPLPAPRWVIDIDPPRGIMDEDVDIIDTTTSMTAVWEAVENADGYEIAVLRAGTSEFMSSPRWQHAGNVTQATITGLALQYGEEYIFAVRALKGSEPSPDAMSDGVTVAIIDGYPAGCACAAGAPDPTVPLVLLFMGLFWRRRVVARAVSWALSRSKDVGQTL